MLRPTRLLLCASAAALILGAAPGADFAFIAPAHAQADVVITASTAPPPLPVYMQPPIPGPGFMWIPGYWAWDGQEFYWVPGYWAMPPAADLLWTPGYWAWDDADNDYIFNTGYWAPEVGYYGGIDYGFGYTGVGYHGGYWRDHNFYYNRAVNNLGNAHIANVFNTPVAAPAAPTRVSYFGGHGGTTVRPTPAELAVAHAHHVGPTAAQISHEREAGRIPSLRYGENHGRPPIPAVARAGEFHGAHVAAAGAGAAAGAALAAHHFANAPNRVAHAGPQRVAHAGPQHFAHAGPQHFAHAGPQRFAHAAPQHFAHAAPHFAMHGPAMHAPAMHQNFARMGAPGGMHFGGAHIAAGGMHFGGAPHIGGGMHFGGAPHFAGGGMHFGGAPHFAGGGMHFGGAPHMGGPGGGPHRP